MTRRGIGGVVRAEWIKLVTVRSTLVAYAATLAASALAAAMIFTLPGADSDGDAGDALLVLVVLVELLAGTIGVLAATSEYSGGTIRATLAAVPSRTPVLVAKAIVHGGTVLVACGLATVMGFAAASILAPDDLAPVSDGEVARGLAGSAFAFSFAAVLGVALGLLTRSTATSLGILFALMFALHRDVARHPVRPDVRPRAHHLPAGSHRLRAGACRSGGRARRQSGGGQAARHRPGDRRGAGMGRRRARGGRRGVETT